MTMKPTRATPRTALAIAAFVAASLVIAPVSTAAALPSKATHLAASVAQGTSALTTSQRQAVIAAKSYLDSGMGFSRQGLMDQLTSEYGSGFSTKDAKAALTSLKPNWKKQAVISARGYLKSGLGFSELGLIDQLTSEYGSGFLKKEATFAIKSLKPNWKKQAVTAAENYMESGIGFSRSSLLDQLTSPYGGQFTKAQAKYAVKKVGL